MHDWKRVVEDRLATLNLPLGTKQDVIAELAAHLEDSAATKPEASDPGNRALLPFQWARLRRAIERTKRKEEIMNGLTKALLLSIAVLFATGLVLLFSRRGAVVQLVIWTACAAMLLCAAASEGNRLAPSSKSVWLPALTTFFGASVSLMVCEFLGMRPHMVWMSRDAVGHNALLFYWPWLATLPIFGAVGACLSQRADGSIRARIAAGLSPALIMLAVMSLVLPFGVAIDGFHFFQLVSFGLMLLNWVVLPALALLIGELPFLQPKLRECR